MSILSVFQNPIPKSSFTTPYIIAEAGVNHEGSIDIAKKTD